MSGQIEQLLRNNQAFVVAQLALDPGYFERLSEGQHPEFLWVGCSDSRVPPDRITGTEPGDMFVHRNIANLVVQTNILRQCPPSGIFTNRNKSGQGSCGSAQTFPFGQQCQLFSTLHVAFIASNAS